MRRAALRFSGVQAEDRCFGAIRDATFTLYCDEAILLTGLFNSGLATLPRLLNGEVREFGGEICVYGRRLTRISPETAEIAVIGRRHLLLEDMTLADGIRMRCGRGRLGIMRPLRCSGELLQLLEVMRMDLQTPAQSPFERIKHDILAAYAAGARDWSDYALDLAGTPIEAELNTDAYNIYDENGKLVSIGYCYECYGIIVNLDLLNQFGSLENIKDFESLKNLVETIESKADETGIHAFTSCDMDSSSSWRFTGHMANLEYYYEQEGNVWTECPPELTGKYMENFKNLYDLAINNSITEPTDLANGGHDASQEFKDGKAVFHVQGSWEYSNLAEDVPNMAMIPYYCGVEGEEKAGLNCGTENCWAINSKASPEDQQATMDFMVWCVTDPEASRMLVDSFGVMPYKNAAESTNAFLANANQYSEDGCYVMNWATNFQPNVDEYRATLVSALNAYNADQSDANWETVKTAFVQGWAVQYKAVNG